MSFSKRIGVVLLIFCLILKITVVPAFAVTRAELLYGVFTQVGHGIVGEKANKFPPDVSSDHIFSGVIRTAAYHGFIDSAKPFTPNEQASKNDALLMALQNMGWGHIINLENKFSDLPDLAGSGNPLSFLCSEITPQAPQSLLVNGNDLLSNEELLELYGWIEQCKNGMVWNKVYSFSGTDLILYKQGIGYPTLPPTTQQFPLFIAAIATAPQTIKSQIVFSYPNGSGRAPLSKLAEKSNAIAAINGGFFHESYPIGTIVSRNTPLSKSFQNRSAIGWTDQGKTHFGSGAMVSSLKNSEFKIPVTFYNSLPKNDEIAVFSPSARKEITGLTEENLIINIVDATIVELDRPQASRYPVFEKGVTVVAKGFSASQLAPLSVGDSLALVTEWSFSPFSNCETVLQAGPMLIKDNAERDGSDEGFQADILYKRHPRTFVGEDNNGRTIWGIVDGRFSTHSVGATIQETRQLAKSLGLINAVNMDGGGSSSLWWRGILINRPSDGKERPIPYAIVFKDSD